MWATVNCVLRVGTGIPHPEASSEHSHRSSSQNLQKLAPQTPAASSGPAPNEGNTHQRQLDAVDEGWHNTLDFGLMDHHNTPLLPLPPPAVDAQVRLGDQAPVAEMFPTHGHQFSSSDELAPTAIDSNAKTREDYLREYGGDVLSDDQINNAFTHPPGSTAIEMFMAGDTDVGGLHAYACGSWLDSVYQPPRYRSDFLVSYSTNPPSAPLSEISNRDQIQTEEPRYLGVRRTIEIHLGSQRRQRRKHGVVKKKNQGPRRTRKIRLADLKSVDLR